MNYAFSDAIVLLVHLTNGMYTDMWIKCIMTKAMQKLSEAYFITNHETVIDIDPQRYIPTRS